MKKIKKIEQASTDEQDNIIRRAQRAQNHLARYLKKHGLDPKKNWNNDPVHGEFIRNQVAKIHMAQDTLANLRLQRRLKKPEVYPKDKTITRAPSVYDYPLLDGKPMTRRFRRKYRKKMRKLTKAQIEPEELKRRMEYYMGRFSNMAREEESKVKANIDKINKPYLPDDDLD